ncbi:MAG: hypothetical protein ABW199_11445 [Caulobacterales bacterium]
MPTHEMEIITPSMTPSGALTADAHTYAASVARVWPRPHARYFALEPARRRLVQVLAGRLRGAHEDHATAFETWSFKRLVAAYLPDAPDGYVEAMRKAADAVWTSEDHRRLASLLAAGGNGAKALRHAQAISPAFISELYALQDELRRPRILALVTSPYIATLLARGAKRIAGHRGDMRRVADRLERARSTEALFRMLIEEIGFEQLAPPPVPGADWLRPLATTREIESAAVRFENCLRYRIPNLLAGRAAYYEALGEEPAIVEIVRDAQGLWVVGEVRGHANAPISMPLWGRIRSHLEMHGARTHYGRPDRLTMALVQAAGW